MPESGFVSAHLERVAGREVDKPVGGHLPGGVERLHAVEADVVGRYGVVGVVVGILVFATNLSLGRSDGLILGSLRCEGTEDEVHRDEHRRQISDGAQARP